MPGQQGVRAGVRVADRLSSDGRRRARRVGIVGPNGAGKTSLFGLIRGELRPDAGDVTLAGQRVTAARRGCAGPARHRAHLSGAPTVRAPDRVRERAGRAEQGGVPVRSASRTPSTGGSRRARRGTVLDLTGLGDGCPNRAGRAAHAARTASGWRSPAHSAAAPRLLLLDEVAGGLTDAEVDELLAIVAADPRSAASRSSGSSTSCTH